MSTPPFVFAYDASSIGGPTVYGALLHTFDVTGGLSVWAGRPVDLAAEIAAVWPGVPVYCGPHARLAAALRQWLPDVPDGFPTRDDA